MLPRRTFHPDGHLSIGIPLNHSHGIVCGEMVFIGGQADIDANAQVTCPNDITEQTRIAMTGMITVLHGLDCEASDLVKLTAFYVIDDTISERLILELIAAQLGELEGPGPAVTLVPIETNCFNGLSIEIEGIAMRGQNGERLSRSSAWIPDGCWLPSGLSQAIRCGQMIFTSGQTSENHQGHVLHPGSLTEQSKIVLNKLDRLLNGLGADLADAVKTNVFNVEPGEMESWKDAALIRASFFPEPGPAATGLSLTRLPNPKLMVKNDVIAMRGIDGQRLPRVGVWPTDHWDWPVHLPYRHGLRVGDLVFLGGQVSLTAASEIIDPANMQAQTHTAMQNIQKVLAELGLDFAHLVKINAFYVGTKGQEDLLKNATVRSEYYRSPGPASTGIPFSYLAYEDMVIEIDCVAMV
ncbi:MAG: hypothetical protein KTR18_15530 [Acidiferrobacterales bacterium]|nr:hypothetical protein [Acidiferrobacterales bacterium]